MFLLDFTSKEPIVSQIHAQIVRFIEAGILSPGDRLPSVRQLAQDNGINPNTVAKAYTMLEQSGVVYNLPKKGVYVAQIDTKASRHSQILTVLRPLKDSGFTKAEILAAADELFEEGNNA